MPLNHNMDNARKTPGPKTASKSTVKKRKITNYDPEVDKSVPTVTKAGRTVQENKKNNEDSELY